MITAGIDIGSRTIAMVVLENAEIVRYALAETGFTPVETVRGMVSSLPPGVTVTATGYGRHAARAGCARRAVTEIKAHALGVSRLCPEAGTVLDIGCQDMKVIVLGEKGSVEDFQMNDKCAAGTGKFLEVMAGALGYPSVEDFGRDALSGRTGTKISSMCTVFAESEAVSLLHREIDRRDIGRALHESVVARALGLLQRVGHRAPLAFSGGVALNPCVVKLLEEKLQERVYVPQNPQLVGALGAALAGEAESDIPNP